MNKRDGFRGATASGDLQSHETPPSGTAQSTVLALIMLATMASLIATHFVARAYRRERLTLATTWLKSGEHALKDGRADEAIDDFRTALMYSPGDSMCELKLAQALAQGGRDAQARTYFLTLLREEPGDGLVNLELARLSARTHNQSEALRYYHAAMYGAWDGNATTMRRTARFELIEFQLGEHASTQARSELIGLTDDLPRDGPTIARVAGMFLAAQDPESALRMFQEALDMGTKTREVYAGAGTAAFDLGSYRTAANYLTRAQRLAESGPITEMLATTNALLLLDPSDIHLRPRERAKRVALAFTTAGNRLHACSADPARDTVSLSALSQEWDALARRVHPSRLARDPDLIEETMGLVFRIEQGTQACPAPTTEDKALLLLAQRRSQGLE